MSENSENSIGSIGEILSLNAGMEPRIAECEKHGAFEKRPLFRSVWSRCPTCESERAEAERLDAEAREQERKRLAWLRKIGGAGIPERFRDRSLDSFRTETPEQEKALAFATDYATDFDAVLATGRSALLIGKPGTGKTHIAVGIGLRIMQRDQRSVLFTTVIRAIRRVKDTWNRGSTETETQAIAALVFPDLLILDEVGVQFGSDTEKMILFDVLNERYERRQPTLLLSNLTLDEVRAYLGERVFDRLREDGGEAVVFDWPSWRTRPQQTQPKPAMALRKVA